MTLREEKTTESQAPPSESKAQYPEAETETLDFIEADSFSSAKLCPGRRTCNGLDKKTLDYIRTIKSEHKNRQSRLR